jgi:hypothetical protein
MRTTKVESAALPADWALPFMFAALAMALATLRVTAQTGNVEGRQPGWPSSSRWFKRK